MDKDVREPSHVSAADNPLGDVVITDPTAMRALAHPVRLAILDLLRRNGPASATELAPALGASPSVTSWHLRHLASFGMVRDSEPAADRRYRRWEAVGRGYRFEVPEDPGDAEARSAARLLSEQMFVRAGEVPARWLDRTVPGLTRPGGGWPAYPTPGWSSARTSWPSSWRDLRTSWLPT